MTSAAQIAAALGLPEPTDQQKAVIEAPLQPSLVLAGAGSGKTETMANRVVYLLANQAAAPSEILGLTFTRKAAGELSERVTKRVDGLGRTPLAPGRSTRSTPRPSRPTTRSPAPSSASTRSPSAGSRMRWCWGRRPPGSWPAGSWSPARTTGWSASRSRWTG
ncbi:UvrD-helicase domain-containing protein [Naasia aerilata]|uniref:UvrD-like helicase ATP-binding domain-containing protein n=1 Tax=Naasia aerilata TaxID=1162966 RepID=A0ABN6XI78_9MICO|nr:UvrD-helicase domain-containing protein [Naasia aerilata]BDZ44560.1 hypothetical protein GCM10025866_04690 [Naasia aerilata]